MIKTRKSFISLLLAMVMLFACSATMFANEEKPDLVPSNNALSQDPNYLDPSRIQARAENSKIINEYFAAKSKQKASGGKKLSVQNVKQDNDYYCGPAVAKQILKYTIGKDYSQATLAANMGTNSSNGTTVANMVARLNQEIKTHKYESLYIGEGSRVDSNLFFQSLIYSIDNNRPMPCNTYARSLPGYEGWGYFSGHYICGTGYYWASQASAGTATIHYNDPNNISGYYGSKTAKVSDIARATGDNYGWCARAV